MSGRATTARNAGGISVPGVPNPVRIMGQRTPPAVDHPTMRLGEGGDVDTYDDLTVAAVLDEHTTHLRYLEGRVQTLEADTAALLLTAHAPAPPRSWWQWVREWWT